MEGMLRSSLCSIFVFGIPNDLLQQILTGDSKEERGIESLSQLPLHGFINDIAIGPKARFCVVAVGQEPRLGRWERVSKAKNRFGIIQLRRDESDSDEETPDTEQTKVVNDDASGSDESSEESIPE